MQYILSEEEMKSLLLCRKYIQELYDSLEQSINIDPNVKNNQTLMNNYKKYKEALQYSHPFV